MEVLDTWPQEPYHTRNRTDTSQTASVIGAAVSDGIAIETESRTARFTCTQIPFAIDAAVSDGMAADISACTAPYISTSPDSLDWEKTLSVIEATSSSD